MPWKRDLPYLPENHQAFPADCSEIWTVLFFEGWRIYFLSPMGEKREGRRKKFPAEAEENFFPVLPPPSIRLLWGRRGRERLTWQENFLSSLSGGGRKGKGPSLLPTLKSDHGKASKLNENGERRVGGPPPWRKFEEERGTLWETAVCGWLQYWMGGRRCGWKSDRLCHLSLLVQRGRIQ